MRFCLIVLMVILTSCRTAAPSATMIPTSTAVPSALTGRVTILTPPQGAVVYSEVLNISGIVSGLPGDTFMLTLAGPDDETIARAVIHAADEEWRIELPHSYIGEPVEASLIARPADPLVSEIYAQQTIALAGLSYRPEGMFGSITFPVEGSTAGGETLLITGSASGVPEGALTVDLIAEDGQTVTRTYAATVNPYLIDDMPWSAELGTQGYTGPAAIQISAQNDNTIIPLAQIQIMIDTAAG